MQHPYEALRDEYANLLQSVEVQRAKEAEAVAARLLRYKARYAAVCIPLGVPILELAPLHERESDANFSTNLAQGDSLNRPSVDVPKGRPPLQPGMKFPVSWEYAAEDAVQYDHLNDNSYAWTMPYALFKGEAWNGFGPRNHGIHTGYLWAGTNHYVKGKYVADGVWDPEHEDKQLGIVPIMLALIELDPSLALPNVAPPPLVIPTPAPLPVPVGVGGGPYTAKWVQHALNVLGYGPLLEDDNYGRRTRRAVRIFQLAHGLKADGLVGPLTGAAIETLMKGKV